MLLVRLLWPDLLCTYVAESFVSIRSEPVSATFCRSVRQQALCWLVPLFLFAAINLDESQETSKPSGIRFVHRLAGEVLGAGMPQTVPKLCGTFPKHSYPDVATNRFI